MKGRSRRRRIAAGCGIVAWVALLSAGCGRRAPAPAPEPAAVQPPGAVVILVADPEGGVGEAEISNAAGAQTLDQANQGVDVRDAQSAPDAPRNWSEEEIAAAFGPALAAQPQSPERFLLYFRTGSSLTGESVSQVAEIVRAIQRRQAIDVSVIGHSDTSGDEQVNFRVSANRARVVADLLLAAGVDPAILEVASHGESDLLVETADDVVEPRNRRVEVVVR